MDDPRILRPMGPIGLLNESFDLYKRNLVLFAGIGGVIYLPFMALTSFLSSATPTDAVLVLVLFGLMLAVHGAIVKAVADRALGVPASIRGVWRALLRRLIPFIVTSIMAWVGLLVGFLFCWIPGVVFGFQIFFLWPVMIVEDRYYFGAFERSRELIAGQWARVLVTGAMIGLLVFTVPALLAYEEGEGEPPPPSAASPSFHVPDRAELGSNLLFAAALAIGTPLPTALSVLLYLDVRVRKEGFDVEWLSVQIGAPLAGHGPHLPPG